MHPENIFFILTMLLTLFLKVIDVKAMQSSNILSICFGELSSRKVIAKLFKASQYLKAFDKLCTFWSSRFLTLVNEIHDSNMLDIEVIFSPIYEEKSIDCIQSISLNISSAFIESGMVSSWSFWDVLFDDWVTSVSFSKFNFLPHLNFILQLVEGQLNWRYLESNVFTRAVSLTTFLES